jgi:small subunit ribosomal protein S15
MSIEQDKVKEITIKFGGNDKNSGASETQIAIFTERIKNITDHLKSNKKDHSGRRGLVALVSKRRRFLDYLKKNNFDSYKEIIKKLNIRK